MWYDGHQRDKGSRQNLSCLSKMSQKEGREAVSTYNLIFCDRCNFESASFPNVKAVDKKILDFIFAQGGVPLRIFKDGTISEQQQRGVAILDEGVGLPPGWREQDYGHECPICVAEEEIAERESAEMGEDETFIGEIPEMVGAALEAAKNRPDPPPAANSMRITEQELTQELTEIFRDVEQLSKA